LFVHTIYPFILVFSRMEEGKDGNQLLFLFLIVVFTSVICLYDTFIDQLVPPKYKYIKPLPLRHTVVCIIKRTDKEAQCNELITLEVICCGLHSFPASSTIYHDPLLLTNYSIPECLSIEGRILSNRYDDYGNPYFIQLSNDTLVINPRLDKKIINSVIETFFSLNRFGVCIIPCKNQVGINEISAENIFGRVIRYWSDNFK